MNKTLLTSAALLFFCLCFLGNFAAAQTWEQMATPPFFKHHSNGFTFDGTAYVFEGILTDDYSSRMWTYDPATDQWSQFESFPGNARGIAIGDEWNGKYYYGFGRTASSTLNDLWVFDPADTSFTQLASCPCVGRTHPAFAAYKDKIFMGTGSSANGDLDDWWIYDIPTDTWSQATDMPGGNRHHPFFFTDEDDVYVGGGHRTTWYKWNITDETWTQIDDEPSGRVAGTQFQHNGYGYVLAGDDRFHDKLPNDEYFMRYDPDTDAWEKLPTIPADKWAPSSFLVGDYVYFFGGLSVEDRDNREMIRFDLSSLDPISSTSELEDGELEVFPNPTSSGTFTVDFTTTSYSDWDIQFTDVTGRNVTDAFIAAGNGTFTTSAKGSFFFNATHKDGRTANRLVILE